MFANDPLPKKKIVTVLGFEPDPFGAKSEISDRNQAIVHNSQRIILDVVCVVFYVGFVRVSLMSAVLTIISHTHCLI